MRQHLAASALLVIAVSLSGCAIVEAVNIGAPVEGILSPADALGALDHLAIGSLGPMSGYTRDRFGAGWVDTDHNGCGTRDDILARDAARTGGSVQRDGRCKVISATLVDPYTGATITKSQIDIDHVVPLGLAWRSGAATWPTDQRIAIANDRRNLLAVTDSVNQSKSDKGPDQWMPPNRGEWCDYARTMVTVLADYSLRLTVAAKSKLISVLKGCQ